MLSCILLLATASAVVLASNEQGRIVGGTQVSIDDFPHQVSIFVNDRHNCGGSILSDKYILTAAHCANTYGPGLLTVYTGLNNTENAVLTSEASKVVKISVHPNYKADKKGIINDIAILEVYPPLNLSATRYPIKVGYFEPKEGDLVTVTGYGTTEFGTASGKLLGVTVETVSKERCNKSYKPYGYTIGDESFCAGYDEGGKDSCQGDSGGPVIHNGKLVGVVSWGIGCAKPKMFGVYTNIAKYLIWIRQNMY